jgi:predicted O-methyltransferase YrrM
LFTNLLSADVQAFIREHERDDTSQLILKLDNLHGVPMPMVAEQIIGRRKSKDRLPIFHQAVNVVYPHGINLEQCSSEKTAVFKSKFAFGADTTTGILADLTGGFGVDSFFFSRTFKEVLYVEPNTNLLQIAQHNHHQLGAANIRYYNQTAQSFLSSGTHSFDYAFIDPSRRVDGNKKVFLFSDCEPNLVALLPQIFEKTNRVLIKASPLLDLKHGLEDLQFVKRIFVISIQNECKEILFLCEKKFADEPTIEAINILKDNSVVSLVFQRSEETATKARFSEPLAYLYEPNAAILKAGAFKVAGDRFGIAKLHPSTHLYTSNARHTDFPGNVFSILAHVKPDFKTLKAFFPKGQANLTTRNYPLSVKELKVRTGLKDGGDQYLIGFSGLHKKYLVVAEKLG